MRGDGRTVYTAGGRVMVRFDSEADRAKFEAGRRLQDCIVRQDIKAAADVVFGAVTTEGIEEDDLLAVITDDEAREIVRLELHPMLEAAIDSLTPAVEDAWQDDHD